LVLRKNLFFPEILKRNTYYKLFLNKSKGFYPLESIGLKYTLCKISYRDLSIVSRKQSLKKIFILLIVVILALAFDGTLAKDIFDYKISSFTDWLLLILIIVILFAIAWANSTKNNHN